MQVLGLGLANHVSAIWALAQSPTCATCDLPMVPYHWSALSKANSPRWSGCGDMYRTICVFAHQDVLCCRI